MAPAPSPETIASHRETATAHMALSIPKASPHELAGHCLERLPGNRFQTASAVYVTDAENRYLGVVPMTELLAADSDRPLGELISKVYASVGPDADQEEVALLAIEHELTAVPVVDKSGKLLGVVPPHAIARILRLEHYEDIARLAGITHAEPHADKEEHFSTPILMKARRRLPWLFAGLGGSALATYLVAGFEELLAENLAVSFFIPALVYLAGAVGSQSVSVAVRDLSGSRPKAEALLARELVTGCLIGLFLGALMALWTRFVFGEGELWVAVGLAIFAASALSTVIGLALPLVFSRLGFDPALGSGPIATILQDIATLALYLVVVLLLMG